MLILDREEGSMVAVKAPFKMEGCWVVGCMVEGCRVVGSNQVGCMVVECREDGCMVVCFKR